MAVGIDEPGNDSASAKIDHFRGRSGKLLYLVNTAGLKEFSVLYCDRRRCGTCGIQCSDFRIVINYISYILGHCNNNGYPDQCCKHQ